MQTINNMTIADLMSEEVSVWVTKAKGFGFDLQIDNEQGETIANAEGIHPCAMDAFADVCRNFLHFYEAAKTKSDAA